MKEWIEEFEKGMQMLDETKRKEQYEAIFRELVWMKDLTLEAWMAMDEQLEDHKKRKRKKKSRPFCSRGTAYFELEMYERAAEQFEMELSQSDLPIIRLYAGFSYLYAKKFSQAKAHFFHIYHYRPKQEKYFALCGLAQLHVQLKQYEDAINYYEMALQINSHPDVVYNLGMCFFHLNKLEQTRYYIQQLLKFSPDDYDAYFLLGRCFILTGDQEQATSAWLCALQLSSAKNDLLAIAYELEEMGNYLAAVHCYNRLLQDGHRDQTVLHGLAWNYGLLDERALSIKWFNKIFTNTSEIDPSVWLSFIWLINKWNHEPLISEYYDKIEQFMLKYPQYENFLKF